MTIGIYKLEFSNNYFYIGRSSNIERRFTDHIRALKNNVHNNKKMQELFLLGAPSLSIVEVCSITDLVKREQVYLDTYFNDKHNINVQSTSEGFGEGWKSANCTTPKILILLVFRNLYLTKDSYYTISNKLNVSVSYLQNIAVQKRHLWLQDKYPKLYKKMQYNNTVRLKGSNLSEYTLVSPSNIHFNFLNIKDFANTQKLCETSVQRVLRGELKYTAEGWRLPSSPPKKEFIIQNTITKEIVIVNNTTDICKLYFKDISLNSSRCGLNRLKMGKAKSYKNWIKYESN